MTKNNKFHLGVLAVLFFVFATAGCASDGVSETAVAVSVHDGDVDFAVFHTELAPHGEWIDDGELGWVWAPHDVWVDWSPYSHGTWIWTDYGWTWHSYWDWGWACFHYGRWSHHHHWGWVWCPGSRWGPAWVAWHRSDSWVGWAPLPPRCRWRRDHGIRHGGAWYGQVGHHWWHFVEHRHFQDHDLRRRRIARHRNRDLLRRTRHVTRLEGRGGRVVNRSFERRPVERIVGKNVARRELDFRREKTRPQVPREKRVGVYRPSSPAKKKTSRRDRPKVSPRRIAEPTLTQRHLDENRRLAERHRRMRQDLEARHRAQAKELAAQKRAEERAELRRQLEREQRTLKQWQGRERSRTPRITNSKKSRLRSAPRQIPDPNLNKPSRGVRKPTPGRQANPSRSRVPSRTSSARPRPGRNTRSKVPAPTRGKPSKNP